MALNFSVCSKERGVTERLSALVTLFHLWLHTPDEEPLLALLGTVAANRRQGDPVWLLNIAPPGGCKTETMRSLKTLHEVHYVGRLTEASLLSGTPAGKVAKEAKGGLLREMGENGLIVVKDFGSILSMPREPRAAVLAALREIYDGHWTRIVGSDGGRVLSWEGRVSLIGGATPAVDSYHSVIAALGERFLLVRHMDVASREHAQRALKNSPRISEMRSALASGVSAFFDQVDVASVEIVLSVDEEARLVDLATFVARCRSVVERDSYSRDITSIHGAESPTRLAVCLRRLYEGLISLGLSRERALAIVRRVSLDSMPSARLAVVRVLLPQGWTPIGEMNAWTKLPSTTLRRALEELEAYEVVERDSYGTEAHQWRLTDQSRELWNGVPKMSEAQIGELSRNVG
jgi:hypothetical protein